jgi:hypothetical protein
MIRIALFAWLLLAVGAHEAMGQAVGPASQGAGTEGTPPLKIVLEKGLNARLPSEFAFVDKVVRLVDEGRLPVSVVDSTFLWARRRQPYPFPYFERALRIRAKRLGVVL